MVNQCPSGSSQCQRHNFTASGNQQKHLPLLAFAAHSRNDCESFALFCLVFYCEKEATAVQGLVCWGTPVLWQLSEMNDARLTFMTAFPQRLQCCKAGYSYYYRSVLTKM